MTDPRQDAAVPMQWSAGTSAFYLHASDRRYTVAKYVSRDCFEYVAWFLPDMRRGDACRVGEFRATSDEAKADAERHRSMQAPT